ncbi:AI-2E family transporter [Luteolibacter pohnpeiensis]|uniref:AI-2E family transporter n=1 Tax=Luteolibacter pohnpeiensis TaxID=454153 RepID=A0A934VQH1_9BACT|nr:AI-2E family transporter [Luteolibacter pohnpeiensis]MBK1882096.1 AI-2E family transporter [Luteolibacter pohnpeiensis]
MRYPTRFQQKTLWNAATGLSILVLGALAVGFIWLVGMIFGFLQPVLVPLIVAGIIAYLLDPIVGWIEKRGISRLWAVVILFSCILVAVAILVAAVLPGIQNARMSLQEFMSKPAASSTETVISTPSANSETGSEQDQMEEKTKEDEKNLVPALARSLHKLRIEHAGGPIGWALTETTESGEPISYANGVVPEPESLDFFYRTRAGRAMNKNMGNILKTGKTWLTAGSTKILGFLGLVLGMIMVPVYLFFFLKDSAGIRSQWQNYVPLKASRFKTELISTLQEINRYLISFFRGQVVVAAIDGVLVGISLEIYDLPYGFLIGIFMAILGVIPYIGNILCLIPACIIAYLHAQNGGPFGLSPWAYTAGTVVIFVVVQQINSLVTAPKIVGDSVGLHPLTVIFSMLFWSLILGGFVGALLAVPFTAAVKVLFRRFIWERQLREEGTDDDLDFA